MVALASVALLTVAALVGTDRGLNSAHQADRQGAADRVAAATADAYRAAGGRSTADLSAARSIAAGADAVLTVRNADDEMISGFSGAGSEDDHGMSGSGRGHHGQGAGSGPGASTPVVVDGSTVGSMRLVFSAGSGSAGLSVAWAGWPRPLPARWPWHWP